jgi:hypothetical protein
MEEPGARFRRGERPTAADRADPSFDASLWWKDEWRPCGCDACAALLEEYGATRYAQSFVSDPRSFGRKSRAEKNWMRAHAADIEARTRAKRKSETIGAQDGESAIENQRPSGGPEIGQNEAA